jgi:hypothetical protein
MGLTSCVGRLRDWDVACTGLPRKRCAIKVRMQLGDLLVRGGLITTRQLKDALRVQGERGGRLGAILVEMGALEQQALEEFLRRAWSRANWSVC